MGWLSSQTGAAKEGQILLRLKWDTGIEWCGTGCCGVCALCDALERVVAKGCECGDANSC